MQRARRRSAISAASFRKRASPSRSCSSCSSLPCHFRRIRWLERFSKPRAASLFDRRWFLRILGVVFAGLAVASAVAPPFSGLDTFPALGAVFVALAIILEDVLALAIGLGVGMGGVVLILTVGAALVHLIRDLF